MKIHIIKQGDTLYHLAQKYHVTVDALVSANPGIDPNNLHIGAKIRIPSSSSGHHHSGSSHHHIIHQHVVKSGDTMWKLSQEWGVPLSALTAANHHIKNPNVLMVGEIINIPKTTSASAPTTTAHTASASTVSAQAVNIPSLFNQEHAQSLPSIGSVVEHLLPGFHIHTVAAGDTLYKIAEQNGISLEYLMALNPGLGDANNLQIGTKILVPKASSEEVVQTYTIQPGDTLWKLSQKWNVSLDAIVAANGQLSNPDQLTPGQVINVPKNLAAGTTAASASHPNMIATSTGKKNTGVIPKSNTNIKGTAVAPSNVQYTPKETPKITPQATPKVTPKVTPQATKKVEPLATKIEPQSNKVAPLATKVEPQSNKVAPLATKVEAQSNKVAPLATKVQSVANSNAVAPLATKVQSIANSNAVAPLANSNAVAPLATKVQSVANSNAVAPLANSNAVAPLATKVQSMGNSNAVAPLANSNAVAPLATKVQSMGNSNAVAPLANSNAVAPLATKVQSMGNSNAVAPLANSNAVAPLATTKVQSVANTNALYSNTVPYSNAVAPLTTKVQPMANSNAVYPNMMPYANTVAPMTYEAPVANKMMPTANKVAPMAYEAPVANKMMPMANKVAPMAYEAPVANKMMPMANKVAPMAYEAPVANKMMPMANKVAPMAYEAPVANKMMPMANKMAPMANNYAGYKPLPADLEYQSFASNSNMLYNYQAPNAVAYTSSNQKASVYPTTYQQQTPYFYNNCGCPTYPAQANWGYVQPMNMSGNATAANTISAQSAMYPPMNIAGNTNAYYNPYQADCGCGGTKANKFEGMNQAAAKISPAATTKVKRGGKKVNIQSTKKSVKKNTGGKPWLNI